jgi:PleD family two-component response regulator
MVRAASEGTSRGSAFTVELPLQAAGPGPQSEPVIRRTNSPPRRILIVEDNVDAAEGMRMVLAQAGHEVAVAHDGPSALEMVHAQRPDVLLCDLGLPGN